MTSVAKEIISSVKEAYSARTALEITGAGTKYFLGQKPVRARALSTTGHSGIIEYDPAELVLVARAGTSLRDIEGLLKENHQMLGFEPPFVEEGATLGGAVAAGLAGPRRAYSGGVRDFILGAKFVNGKGESVTAGGKVMKNVAGFDLFRPMAGSMGTLGVLLDVSLRLLPVPELEKTLVQEESDERRALQKMNRWPCDTQAISAICWDGQLIRIRLSGSSAGIEHARTHIGGQFSDDHGYWQRLNNFKLDFFQQAGRLWRLSLAPLSEPLGIDSMQLIDWGGAQRWLKSDQQPETIRSRVSELGGHAECFSDDLSVATYHPMEGPVLAINQRFKDALDPAGILNPGRLQPEFQLNAA